MPLGRINLHRCVVSRRSAAAATQYLLMVISYKYNIFTFDKRSCFRRVPRLPIASVDLYMEMRTMAS